MDYEKLISAANLLTAWSEFYKGKSGRLDVAEFEMRLEDNLFVLRDDLAAGAYRHGPYRTFHIYDPKHRVISKASVRDRVVHHLVFKELYRIFDPWFIFHSYSSREDKGTHLAVENLFNTLRAVSKNYTRPCFVLKCDIRKFFDSVPHGKLMSIIQNKINDSRFLRLAGEVLNSFSVAAPNCCGGGPVMSLSTPLGG